MYLRDVLRQNLETKRTRVGANSTKSAEVMLWITMRLLAGASYLDVGWGYRVARATTYALFYKTISALNKTLPPISFPQTEEQCCTSSEQFRVLRKSPFYGIIAALDGIAIRIQQPNKQEVPDQGNATIEKDSMHCACRQQLAQITTLTSSRHDMQEEHMTLHLFKQLNSVIFLKTKYFPAVQK